MRFLVVLTCLLAITSAAPRTIVLQSVIRDFTPETHPDFEAYLGDSRGAILSTLDQDGKPVLVQPTPPKFTSAVAFSQWYRDSNLAKTILKDITFTETGDGTGIFAYDNSAYFPIDGEGWGNYGNTGHNFHFTTEIHTVFTFLGNETFGFTGDDDLWIFINGKLAIDLGGVHGPESANLNLADPATQASLGLVVGNDYNLDIFNAERHTTGSNFRVGTSLRLVSIPPNVTAPANPWICGVQLPNFATNGVQTPAFRLFNTDDSVASFENFNAIAFDSFTSAGGDTEGRVAVGGDLTFTGANGGYSVGEEIVNSGTAALDLVLPYSLVVGGNWISSVGGSVKPDGNDPSKVRENAFVAGNQPANAGFASRIQGRCSSGSTCLNADFTNARAWYTLASAALAAQTDNAQFTILYGTQGYITCPAGSTGPYYVTVTGAALGTITAWKDDQTFPGCNRASSLTINVVGSGDITIQFSTLKWGLQADQDLLRNKPTGDNQNRVLYNIVGSGRTVNAGSTAPTGILLNPNGKLNHPYGVWKGVVIVGTVLASNQINRLVCPAHPVAPNPPPSEHICPYYENSCAGFGFNLPQRNVIVSFRDFNVVTFGSFYDHGGDVEGRLAVGGNADLDNFAVGLELHTVNGPDNSLPYSLVVAGDATWGVGGGQVWPTGDANIDKWPATREDIFVGGNFNAPAYLQERRTGMCTADQPHCLDQWFTNAKACYVAASSGFSSATTNVDVSTQYTNGLLLSCHSNSATRYIANVDAADMSKITWYFLDNCNFHAEWVINIVGTGNVVITGGSFPAVAGGVVYNVAGNRYIEVRATSLAGHLLAPNANLNQTSSVIVGKVVVNNFILANQVNKPCPAVLDPVTLTSVVTSQTLKRQTSDSFTATDVFRVGDIVSTESGKAQIIAKDGSSYLVAPAFSAPLSQGSVVSTTVLNPTQSRYLATPAATTTATSSASGVVAMFALIAAIVALF